MIKKINEDRRDDIIKARDEWETNYNKIKTVHDNQEKNYRMAQRYVQKYLENTIRDEIGNTSLNLDIRVDPYGSFDYDSYSVGITSDDTNKFDENVALSWSWDVVLDKDGNVKKDSSSWSGLKATTPEQIDSLAETLRVLKTLNNIDWKTILEDANKRMPQYQNYVDTHTPSRADRPRFEDELKQAVIDDIIGKPILIKGYGNHYNNEVWYLIVGQTPKQYKVIEFPEYSIKNHEELGDLQDLINDYLTDKRYADGITKDKFMYKLPQNPDNIITKEV